MLAGAHLLYVVNDAGFFLSHRLPLARAARRADMRVSVATPDGPLGDRIRDEGFAHHPVRLSRAGMRPAENLRGFVDLVRLYRALRPDLVHHVTIKPVLFGSVAARLTGVPAVVNAPTGMGWVFVEQGLAADAIRLAVRGAYRLIFRHPRMRVLFHNPEDRAGLLAEGLVRAEQAVLVGGAGVDTARYAPAPEPDGAAPVVVLAARLLWQKGVGEFVEAARMLRREGTRARMVLVGDADVNPSSVPPARLSAWHDEGIIEWWGQRDDMPAVFAGCNVVCLPSYREGLPKVLLEAAACGRAIVATDVPGCRQIARHEENALLVPPRDAAALARALRRLIESPAERARMGARGREIAVAEFAEERVVGETLAAYEELLA